MCYLLPCTVGVDQRGGVLRRVFVSLMLHVAALVELSIGLHVRVGEAARVAAQSVIAALIFGIIPTQHHKHFISPDFLLVLPLSFSLTNLWRGNSGKQKVKSWISGMLDEAIPY